VNTQRFPSIATLPRIVSAVALVMLSLVAHARGETTLHPYQFDGTVTSSVLENYLSRAVQCAGSLAEQSGGRSDHLDDDFRMISHLRAKFIGRAAIAWTLLQTDDAHFEEARNAAEQAHSFDPGLILQACDFEVVQTSQTHTAKGVSYGVDAISVPDWVFKEFGLPVENRCFNYDAMLFSGGRFRDHWGPGASAPDVTRLETRLWYYYRAKRYIDVGYEAIHFGQSLFVGLDDHDHKAWDDMLTRVRRYASLHARRHWVFCDSHVVVTRADSPLKIGDRLLWDFLSFPLRPEEITEPLKVRLRAGYRDAMYGKSAGGIHPAGWTCEALPQLYEFDNCVSGLTTHTEATVWGADEATWFANQTAANRNEILSNFQDWIWTNSPHGYLAMPGRRPAYVPITDSSPRFREYALNTRSPLCPGGFSQEETVRQIWASTRFADVNARPHIISPLPLTVTPARTHTLDELRAFYRAYGVQGAELTSATIETASVGHPGNLP
jgi:hypothetical protein